MFHSRISVIEGHPRDTYVDQLYKPLRDTFLLDTTAKKTFLDDVSKYSHISNHAQTHTYQQNYQIGHQTLILEDVHLIPTHDPSKIPTNRHYSVINAQQKVGEPITPEQLERRLKKAEKQQIIVYVYDEEPHKEQPVIPESPKVQTEKPKPLSRPKSGLKVTQPKYNLFSLIDEAFNSKSCVCPANQLIASQRSEANWSQIKKLQNDGFL